MKLPFQFSMKFVFRLLLPGFILASAMAPLLHWFLHILGIWIEIKYLFPLEVVGWGWAIIICDMYIYMLFEGRRYWPIWVRDWLIVVQKRRLERLREVIESDVEAAVEYALYPVDDAGKAYVAYPTRVGNIIEASEAYPKVKYGLDAVFYWYRLWVVLDKDLREEIDNAQAVADSTIYVTFVLYVSGMMMWLYAIMELLAENLWPSMIKFPYIPGPKPLVVLGAACFLVGFFVYRLSLPVHVQFGEIFKSIFDQFRLRLLFDDVVKEVGQIKGDADLASKKTQSERNKIAWLFLRWHRIHDEFSNKNLTVGEWQDRKKSKAPAGAP